MQLEAQLRQCQTCLWCYRAGKRLFSRSHIYRSSSTYYELLGVKSDATVEEIKKAFFDKSKKLHPDSDPSNSELHSQFIKLNEAYSVLSKKSSRQEYDLKLKHPYKAYPAHATTSRYNDPSDKYSSDTYKNNRYWEQFRQTNAHNIPTEEWQKRRSRNMRIMSYCIIAIMLSVGAHFLLFRKLEEIHNNYMDEKDQLITAIYNKSKERARVNSFEKQMEILSQKHAEFSQKYKLRRGGDE